MLSVYRVIPDLDNFQYISADDVEKLMNFRFDGTPIRSDWAPPRSNYLANPKKPRPDIWGLGYPALFAVAGEAASDLVTFIDQSCEGLPINCGGARFLVCNVTCVVNALDTKKSRHAEGVPHFIEEYAFHSGRFEYSLFKIPETAESEILCVEGLAAPEDEFKGTVEKLGLKGLVFRKIWSGRRAKIPALKPPPKRRRKPQRPKYQFGIESNGILMTPEEFDSADPDDFDQTWDYELINGVLVVSPIPVEQEADPNDELGCLLRTYCERHSEGHALDTTLPRRYVKCGHNRRKPDRLIWAGLGRLPRKGETPTVIVEFVSSRKRYRVRDYETKHEEYRKIKVQEYWIIDRFERTMTVHVLENSDYRKKVVTAKQAYRTKLLPGFEVPLARLLALADQWDDQEEEPQENQQ
jgi:Uma2 family endonuclease